MLEFWLPMALLFIAATITAIAARRKRDRCLNYFNKESVLIRMQSGKWIWGKFMAFPKAMELVFEEPQKDVHGCIKGSYVLYSPEVEGIKTIIQAPPKEGTQAHARWKKEIKRVANPSLFSRFSRWMWNVFNTLRDAVSQSLSMLIGNMKKATPMGKVSGADKRAGEIGNTLLGTIPNSYEPVLEKYLSKQVIVEMLEEGTVVEFSGLLQEYSSKYLLLRNVAYQPDLDLGKEMPDRFDIIFPRSKALVRHALL